MRVHTIRNAAWLAVFAVFLMAFPARSAEPVPVKVASVAHFPEAVQKTVKSETAGGRIRGLWKELDAEGKTVYEVESVIKGRIKDLNIAEDGTVLVCEQQVTLAELPASVRETMLSAAGKRKIRLVESVTKLGQLAYYEAHVGAGKTLEEITVSLDGARTPR